VMHSAKVLLHWLNRPSDGSPNDNSPLGEHFSRPARFDHQGDDWTDDAWSLVVDVKGRPNIQGKQDGTARFLMPTAPQEWLSVGKKFTLFEGRTPVAKGEVKRVSPDAKRSRRKVLESGKR
jgi:hypothetical protein